MNINIDDKFIAVKSMWFIDEGVIVTVTNVDNDEDIISFTFGENNLNNGYMDFNTFIEHFEKVKADNDVKTYKDVSEIMEDSEFEIQTVFDKCVVVSCRLPNEFVIVESASCDCASEYDEEELVNICLDKIFNKICELESYRFHCEIEEEFDIEVETDIEIDVEEDEEDDVDCCNCDDYSCPDNPNYRFNN